LGFTFKDVNIGFLTGDKGGKSNRKKRGEDEEDDSDAGNSRNSRGGGSSNSQGVNDNRGRNLLFNLDFKISDDVTYNNLLDSGQGFVPIRGTKTITISPYIDYEVSKDFTLQFFFDYQKTSPYTLGSNDRVNINSGFKLRFNLN
jgi:cell surface protein SprA